MSGEGPTDDDRDADRGSEHDAGHGGERGDERKCSGCGEPLQDSQDWCLKCGAAAGRRRIGRPGWRSAATVIGASLVLALGAAAAAYAALNESSKSKTPTVAETPATTPPGTPPGTTTPGTGTEGTVPGASTPGEGAASGEPAPEGTTGTEPEASGSKLPSLPANPPSIPGSTPTPSASETGGSTAEEKRLTEEQLAEEERLEAEELQKEEAKEQNAASEGNEGGEGGQGGQGGQGGGSETLAEEEQEAEEQEEQERQKGPSPILLDTNAAHLYNPYEYPESQFGDPSLTIDGEATTVWKAKVNPETAPKMAVGLSINLKADLHVSKLTLITNTKGMMIQVYGTKRKHLPKTITSKGWVKLTGPHVVNKHKSLVNLRYSKKDEFRQILIWFMRAPSSSTPEEPGHIAVNELELYEPPAS